MRVRRLDAGEWERWREFRLAMLKDAPMSFGSTYAEAVAFDDQRWRDRAHAMATSAETVLYVAEEDGDWLACAGGYVEDGIPNVFGVWTRPDARGRGYADACVRTVVEWARTTAAKEVRLWATDGNAAAQKVYERIGFTPTGTTQPLPHTPSTTESEYALPL